MEDKENKRSFRARLEHKELMLQEAEKNPIIITMNFCEPNSRANYNKCWELLTAKLNSLGFGEKCQDKWRRVLTDWISVTKSKYVKIKKEREKTGGGPFCGVELTSLEERLLAIKGLVSVEGDNTTPELGLLSSATVQIDPSTSANVLLPYPTPTPTEQNLPVSDVMENEEILSQRRCRGNTNMAKSIQEMHEETLDELRNINTNMNIIAECMININNTLTNSVVTETSDENI